MLIKCFILLLCFGSISWASDSSMVIKHGAYNNPPWMIENQGEVLGVIPRYVEGIVERSGKITMPTQSMSFSRGLLELKKGGIDMIVAPFDADFLEFADPLVPIGNLSLSLYSKPAFAPDSFDELNGKRIAALRVLDVKSFFTENSNIQWTELISEGSGVESVAKGYLDGIICTEVGYKYAVESHAWPQDTLAASIHIGKTPIFAWILKGRQVEAKFIELKRVVEQMTRTGLADEYLNGVGMDFGLEAE